MRRVEGLVPGDPRAHTPLNTPLDVYIYASTARGSRASQDGPSQEKEKAEFEGKGHRTIDRVAAARFHPDITPTC